MVVEADGLLLDLDGVVWIDGRVPPGVAEMLQMLRSRGLPVLFFDQRPRARREQYVDRLNASGVPATAEQVLPALVLPRGWSPSGNPRAPRFWSGQPGAVRRGLGRRPATGRPRSRVGHRFAVLIGGHESFGPQLARPVTWLRALSSSTRPAPGSCSSGSSRRDCGPSPAGTWSPKTQRLPVPRCAKRSRKTASSTCAWSPT